MARQTALSQRALPRLQRRGPKDFLLPLHERYFPIRGWRVFLTRAGIFFRSVIMAYFNALAHSHRRSRATFAAAAFRSSLTLAVLAFKFPITISTVTASSCHTS